MNKVFAAPIRMANTQVTGNTSAGKAVRCEYRDACSGQWEIIFFLLRVGMQEDIYISEDNLDVL